ncbi:hypothetical protein [Actinomadura madurae]|uniref:hypothetical protein n=1 Tax=Actinomadura madurae TaxID=1993 RepID=UPI0020D21675|nr:hypothetical protein [Actinomadura madurae]MCP9979866.1 hypothetical protein [Actinomadura madurae]
MQMQPQAQTFHRVPDAPERPAAAERLAEELTADPAEKSATTKIYRVQPPEGGTTRASGRSPRSASARDAATRRSTPSTRATSSRTGRA